MNIVEARPYMLIYLGRVGENLSTQVRWSGILSEWEKEFGEGTVQLFAQRPTESAPYPATTDVQDGTIVWNVSSADVAISGKGGCELTYVVDGVVVKSQTWETLVRKSLTATQPTAPPQPYQNWVDEVIDAAEKVEAATVSPPKIGENNHWYVWDFEKQQYVDTGIDATGGGLDVDFSKFNQSIIPDTEAAYDLGKSESRWGRIYCKVLSTTEIHGNANSMTIGWYLDRPRRQLSFGNFTDLFSTLYAWYPWLTPSVTTADKGKFLRVSEDGVWAAETVPDANGGEF